MAKWTATSQQAPLLEVCPVPSGSSSEADRKKAIDLDPAMLVLLNY